MPVCPQRGVGSRVTITRDALDLNVQGPLWTLDLTPHIYLGPAPTGSDIWWLSLTPVQPCSLDNPLTHTDIWWLGSGSGQCASYWNAFLLSCND